MITEWVEKQQNGLKIICMGLNPTKWVKRQDYGLKAPEWVEKQHNTTEQVENQTESGKKQNVVVKINRIG